MVSFSQATALLLPFLGVLLPGLTEAMSDTGSADAGDCARTSTDCGCDLGDTGADEVSLQCKAKTDTGIPTCKCIKSFVGGVSVEETDCSFDDCCASAGRRNRRHLLFQDADKIIRVTREGQDVVSAEAPEYSDYVNKCGGFEYETSLHVDSHLVAIASPKDEALAAGCPFVAVHSTTDTSEPNGVTHKELVAWKDKTQAESHFKKENAISMGTFKAAELVQAFEDSAPSSPDSRHAGYDILTNNCATLMINLASQLGVKIDMKVTSFVARRLFQESGSKMVDQIKSSVNYFNFFGKRNLRAEDSALTDEEMVAVVVESQAAPLLKK